MASKLLVLAFVAYLGVCHGYYSDLEADIGRQKREANPAFMPKTNLDWVLDAREDIYLDEENTREKREAPYPPIFINMDAEEGADMEQENAREKRGFYPSRYLDLDAPGVVYLDEENAREKRGFYPSRYLDLDAAEEVKFEENTREKRGFYPSRYLDLEAPITTYLDEDRAN